LEAQSEALLAQILLDLALSDHDFIKLCSFISNLGQKYMNFNHSYFIEQQIR
jgi:hypothetical protein